MRRRRFFLRIWLVLVLNNLRICRDKLDATVQSCVECYTSDFVAVRRKHQHFSSASRARSAVRSTQLCIA